jgi:hypothetical protein
MSDTRTGGIQIVLVTYPGGEQRYWAVATPLADAAALVLQLAPPGSRAILTNKRLARGRQGALKLRAGYARELKDPV